MDGVNGFAADLQPDSPAGIFARLNDLGSLGLVKVTPSDTICDNCANVIVPGWRQHWFSFHPNPWISFDFSPRSVAVGAYSLRTYSGAANCGHLKSWALEGSDDSLEWTEVDSQTDSAALNGSSFVGVFRCAGGRPFQVVRLRLTGPNHAGTDFLVLRGIELFGAFQ